MKILMIGTGYVGLVTGTCFAEMGHSVTCLDIDKTKIANLKKGILPIYEPGLEELILRNVKDNRLFFTNDYSAVSETDALFIAVPTPSREDGSCNTSYIESASREIGKNLKRSCLIVNKSTAPVGTVALIQKIICEETEVSFEVASNPEFLKEGSAIPDCMKPDRIVIGTESESAEKMLREIYAPFTLKHDRIIAMDIRSSELTKYAANAMLATRISFMNELALIAKNLGANINDVRKGIGSDSRIGYSFLYAGIGYGGSCFPKDIRALMALAKGANHAPKLLEAVEEVNNNQKKVLPELLENYFAEKGGLTGKTIALWGLSFKPDTDDVRDAPSLTIIDALQKKGAHLRLYDPIAMKKMEEKIGSKKGVTFCSDAFDAAKGTDAICLLTEWKQFRLVDFAKITPCAFFDGRNQYRAQEMLEKGFDYIGIGIPDQRI